MTVRARGTVELRVSKSSGSRSRSTHRPHRGMRSGRRGSSTRNHLPILYRRRWPRHVRLDIGTTECAVLRRPKPNGVCHLRAIQSRRREVLCAPIDRLSVHEGIA